MTSIKATVTPHPRTITPGLYLLTAVCGIVDATTFLALGGVFAEIMTGNLMFLAFGIGEGKAVESVSTYVVPIVTFSLGAVGGGAVLHNRRAANHQRVGYVITATLVGAAVVLAMVLDPVEKTPEAMVIVGVLAFAMGLQNALVLAHAVPDVATNVMTLTLVRLLSNLSIAGGSNARWQYRMTSLGVFLAAAMVGAAAVQASVVISLGLALAVYLVALPWLLTGAHPPASPASPDAPVSPASPPPAMPPAHPTAG